MNASAKDKRRRSGAMGPATSTDKLCPAVGTKDRLYYLDNLRTFLIFLVVLVHAGVVYESSGLMAPYWIVDDPSTSDLPGLLNLILDLLVIPTIFFISGYFTPSSLERNGSWRFLKAKFRRLLLPWLIAVFTLIPLYNMVFLYSRGLPQEGWATYFHFSNGVISMSWLWFLPVLFIFDALYLLLQKLNVPTGKLTLNWAVVALFVLSLGYCEVLSELDWLGWTKTPLVDFQNERLLPYFLVFLLGSLCYRKGILATDKRNMKLFIAVNATAWIPINIYVAVLLNFFLRPGNYIISADVDGFVLWFSLHLSMLSLLYCAVTTFKYYFNRQGRLGRALSKLSYNVYIIHIMVLGAIALVLLKTDMPALLKYPILALTTYIGSNLLVYAYTTTVEYLVAMPATSATRPVDLPPHSPVQRLR
jgi:surface polysaccharide O-acyltransferase-like enzyme